MGGGCEVAADFNPRSPCGERRIDVMFFDEFIPISTHAPRAGSDISKLTCVTIRNISTHAPRAGSDSPHEYGYPLYKISTHAPRAGSDVPLRYKFIKNKHISTHAPRAGSDV